MRVPAETPKILPVDNDGVTVVTIGTIAWFIALGVLLCLQDRLRHDGHLWWIACAASGAGLGVLGVVNCLRRRSRLARRKATSGSVG